MLKLMILPRTRTGMLRHEMQDHLERVHGPLCLRHPDVSGHFRRYVHHYATDAPVDLSTTRAVLADRDALTIIAFDDLEAFQASTSSTGYRAEVGPDEASFSEKDGSLFFFAEEHVLQPGPPDPPSKIFHLRRLAHGMDPDQESRRWVERIGSILPQHQLSISGYVHNRVRSSGPERPAYDMIDEICVGADLMERVGIADLGAALAQAETGPFEREATALMVTRPKVFIA